MDVLIAILEGIPGAFLATVVTVLAVRLLPPKIDFSPLIATAWFDVPGELRNRFKIVNLSRRAMVDVRFELVIIYYRNGVVKTKLVEPERPPPMSIVGRSQKDEEGESGSYVLTYGERLLDALIEREAVSDEGCKLRLRVFGRDSFSGAGKQFEIIYTNLFDGTFVYGTFDDGVAMGIKESGGDEWWLKKLSEAGAAMKIRAQTD